ncbi:hypothetical protein LSTR_LSTR008101 [Laodelphax striatellus]|uniref:Uncharacterized protein n=1 Tax=Laodelphax striatellus TaxID=195883 RepID=A0A482XDN1_LAOST|nr:hypothetical protein LSTR_LSTR008101 [Laodelphax striatellus]
MEILFECFILLGPETLKKYHYIEFDKVVAKRKTSLKRREEIEREKRNEVMDTESKGQGTVDRMSWLSAGRCSAEMSAVYVRRCMENCVRTWSQPCPCHSMTGGHVRKLGWGGHPLRRRFLQCVTVYWEIHFAQRMLP